MFKSLKLSEKCTYKKCGNIVSKNELNKACDEMNRNTKKQCGKIKGKNFRNTLYKSTDCEIKVYKKSRCGKLTTKLLDCSLKKCKKENENYRKKLSKKKMKKNTKNKNKNNLPKSKNSSKGKKIVKSKK